MDTPDDQTLRIEATEQAGHHRLVLAGELDMRSTPELESLLTRLCTEGASEIEIDLQKVTFIDSTGLRVVLWAKEFCAEHRCEFFLVPVESPGPRRLLDLTGLQNLLPWR